MFKPGPSSTKAMSGHCCALESVMFSCRQQCQIRRWLHMSFCRAPRRQWAYCNAKQLHPARHQKRQSKSLWDFFFLPQQDLQFIVASIEAVSLPRDYNISGNTCECAGGFLAVGRFSLFMVWITSPDRIICLLRWQTQTVLESVCFGGEDITQTNTNYSYFAQRGEEYAKHGYCLQENEQHIQYFDNGEGTVSAIKLLILKPLETLRNCFSLLLSKPNSSTDP